MSFEQKFIIVMVAVGWLGALYYYIRWEMKNK
jgi:hypothetical protein